MGFEDLIYNGFIPRTGNERPYDLPASEIANIEEQQRRSAIPGINEIPSIGDNIQLPTYNATPELAGQKATQQAPAEDQSLSDQQLLEVLAKLAQPVQPYQDEKRAKGLQTRQNLSNLGTSLLAMMNAIGGSQGAYIGKPVEDANTARLQRQMEIQATQYDADVRRVRDETLQREIQGMLLGYQNQQSKDNAARAEKIRKDDQAFRASEAQKDRSFRVAENEAYKVNPNDPEYRKKLMDEELKLYDEKQKLLTKYSGERAYTEFEKLVLSRGGTKKQAQEAWSGGNPLDKSITVGSGSGTTPEDIDAKYTSYRDQFNTSFPVGSPDRDKMLEDMRNSGYGWMEQVFMGYIAPTADQRKLIVDWFELRDKQQQGVNEFAGAMSNAAKPDSTKAKTVPKFFQ